MPSASIVQSALADHNRDYTTRAFAAAFMGAVTALAIYAFILITCWVLSFTLGFAHWFWIATGIFTLFMLVGAWSSRRGIEPLVNVGPLTDVDIGAAVATYAATGMIASPRHTVAGAADLIMHGPRSLLESIGLWRSRISASPGDVAAATAVLARLVKAGRLRAGELEPGMAVPLLIRFGFARFEQLVAGGTFLMPTVKGVESVSGHGR